MSHIEILPDGRVLVHERCATCIGSGLGEELKPCADCNGSGRGAQTFEGCQSCGGHGGRWGTHPRIRICSWETCDDCEGTGRKEVGVAA